MKNIRLYDNGGKTYDRYTAVFTDRPYYAQGTTWDDNPLCEALGFNNDPFHPQGFGQHTSATPGRHLGKRIKLSDLPEKARKFVEQNMENES